MTRHAATCALLFALLIAGPSSSAQVTGDLVILSPRVGDYIDSAESAFFHVFQNVKGLQRAHVIVTRDSLLYVVFEIDNPPMPQKIEYVQYSLTLINLIAEKIEHIEGLIDGTYVMGTQPAALRTIHGTSPAVRVPTRMAGRPNPVSEPYDALPLAGRVVPMTARYPQFGFTAGVSTYDPDLGELLNLVTSVEDYYRQTGYPVPYQAPDNSSSVLLLCSASAVFSSSFEMGLDIAYQEGLLTMKGVGVSARYFPAFLRILEGVRGFLSAGIQLNVYSISSTIDYRSQIGPADSVGRYMMLARISIGGNERQIAPLFGAGIQYGHTGDNPIGLTVFMKYLLAQPLTVSSRVGSCQIKTSSAMFGVSAALYF